MIEVAIEWAECPACGGNFVFVESDDLDYFCDGAKAVCSCGQLGQLHCDAENAPHIEWDY